MNWLLCTLKWCTRYIEIKIYFHIKISYSFRNIFIEMETPNIPIVHSTIYMYYCTISFFDKFHYSFTITLKKIKKFRKFTFEGVRLGIWLKTNSTKRIFSTMGH